MDWEWEDRPPSDTPPPRRAAGESGAADSRPPEPEQPPRPERPEHSEREPERPPLPERPERPEHSEPEPLDESVTQVFSAEAAWDLTREPGPVESVPPAPPREYVLPERTETGRPAVPRNVEFERPSLRTIEEAERAVVAGDRGSDYGGVRRARSPQERTARREQRRRQLRRRRLVALAVLIVIVVLIVVLVVRGCGGSGAGTAAAVVGTIFIDRGLLAAPERG